MSLPSDESPMEHNKFNTRTQHALRDMSPQPQVSVSSELDLSAVGGQFGRKREAYPLHLELEDKSPSLGKLVEKGPEPEHLYTRPSSSNLAPMLRKEERHIEIRGNGERTGNSDSGTPFNMDDFDSKFQIVELHWELEKLENYSEEAESSVLGDSSADEERTGNSESRTTSSTDDFASKLHILEVQWELEELDKYLEEAENSELGDNSVEVQWELEELDKYSEEDESNVLRDKSVQGSLDPKEASGSEGVIRSGRSILGRPSLIVGQRIERVIKLIFCALGLSESDIPPGYKRIRWANHRGRRLFDDYIEHRPGALQALERYLNTSAYRKKAPGSTQHDQPATSRHIEMASGPVSSTQRTKQEASNVVERPLQTARPTVQDVEQAEVASSTLHLLCSIVIRRYGRRLRQEPITSITTDQMLFSALQDVYHKQRGRTRPYLTLTTVRSIDFMKCKYGSDDHIDVRCHNELCDSSKPCDCVPPLSNLEYECDPRPPDISPPVGPNLMMDCFTHPETISKDNQWIFNQLPKRTRGKLKTNPSSSRRQDAWGIHFDEGWDLVKIWLILMIGFIIPSLVFGIVWSRVMKDVQGAFGIASVWITCGTVFLGSLHLYHGNS